MESLKDILSSLVPSKGLPFDLRDGEIWKVWEEVVGPQIAQHAEPLLVNNGILTVVVRQPIWLQQLNFLSEDLRRKLNERLGRDSIKSIRLKLQGR